MVGGEQTKGLGRNKVRKERCLITNKVKKKNII